jgi:hypothetical protein
MGTAFQIYHGAVDLPRARHIVKGFVNIISIEADLPAEVVNMFVKCRTYLQYISRMTEKIEEKVEVGR